MQSNNTSNGRWKIYRGIKNIYEAGQAVEVNGQRELTVWKGERCNRVSGTDGILKSPFRRLDKPLTFFAIPLCAAMDTYYKRRASYRGIDTYVFEMKLEENVANESCFCRNPDKCPIRGTMDLLPCVQAPVTVSHPHFLYADPSLLANIGSGLVPNEKKHECIFTMEIVNYFL